VSESISTPSSREMVEFLIAYFGDRCQKHGKSKKNHYVFRVADLEENIAVPLNRERLAPLTFDKILRASGIAKVEFRRIAGTEAKLKQYVKQQKKRNAAEKPKKG